MNHFDQLLKLLPFLIIVLLLSAFSPVLSAQEMGQRPGMMGDRPEELDFLEKEIQGGQNLHVIGSRTGEMLNYLDELSKMRAAQSGRSNLPFKKEMMK